MPPNWIELNLTQDENDFVRAAAAIYRTVHIDTITNVFQIAKAIEIIRKAHYGSGSQGAYGDALVQYGFTARDGTAINKAIRSAYADLLRDEAAVRVWWESVPDKRKREWLSASAVYRHWKASQRPRDPNAARRQTPLQAERATNVELQRQLHEAQAELLRAREGDEFSRFDIDRDSPAKVGQAIAAAWAASPSKIEKLIETLRQALPEIKRRHRTALPRRRRRRGEITAV
jgi:hypothetical protein